MAEQKYKGPFRVVVLYDGAANESIVGAGLDEPTSSRVANAQGDADHVQRVRIEDEPTGHTVRIVYDRYSEETPAADEPREPYPAA